MWRGRRHGATSTASNRMSQARSSPRLASLASAAATIRRRCRSVTASAASSNRPRADPLFGHAPEQQHAGHEQDEGALRADEVLKAGEDEFFAVRLEFE